MVRRPSVAVVIPVRDAGELLMDCLSSISPQLTEDDELIVVDDGSTDDSPGLAACLGATVLRLERSSGPYAARNHGWRHASQDVVVFTDVRCRARGGWLDTIRASMQQKDIALACSNVEIIPGSTCAGQVMFQRQTFLTHHTNQDRFFLPFFPTCNLAVRRSALHRVEGFADVRSGGDADLCWRIQLSGAGRLAAVDETTMDWVPRTRTRALLRQWARYGRSQAHLRWRYRDHGLDATPPSLAQRTESMVRVVAIDLIRRRAALDVALLDGLTTWVHNAHLGRELRAIIRQSHVSGGRQPA